MNEQNEISAQQASLADALDTWAAMFMRGEGVFFGEHHYEKIAQILRDAAEDVRKAAS